MVGMITDGRTSNLMIGIDLGPGNVNYLIDKNLGGYEISLTWKLRMIIIRVV